MLGNRPAFRRRSAALRSGVELGDLLQVGEVFWAISGGPAGHLLALGA
jgi:hypothetical protein